jgi:hypothetical protein
LAFFRTAGFFKAFFAVGFLGLLLAINAST